MLFAHPRLSRSTFFTHCIQAAAAAAAAASVSRKSPAPCAVKKEGIRRFSVLTRLSLLSRSKRIFTSTVTGAKQDLTSVTCSNRYRHYVSPSSLTTGNENRESSSSSEAPTMVRVLNVAEKNDAAKHLAELMSRGGYRRREGYSRYNKIYEYEYNLLGRRCTMVMTSVSGHLLTVEFVGAYRKWTTCNPLSLFDAPVSLDCIPDFVDIKNTLEREIQSCDILVIWTDCDREGENIGFEVIEVCRKAKPNFQVYRARFSEITPQAIFRACQNLSAPDKRVSDAVNVRRELDLRIGAAFTRFQTMRLKRVFPAVLHDQLVSYGSCQFPTLGFVVERYKQVQSFVPEEFFKIRVSHLKEGITADFSWKRGRLFDHTACLVIYTICLENPQACVTSIQTKPKSKWRPLPLETVELEKLASRKLRINAKEVMQIAERLYTQGYISYPRTETNIFPKELDLQNLVQIQVQDHQWGEFAQRVLEQGPNPRQGNKSDKAHPPIHPTKYATGLQGNDQRVYELIVRHFLACLSADAQGRETTVDIVVADEQFSLNGLVIVERNYLDVYPYDKWNAKIIPHYQQGEIFVPTAIMMDGGETSPPPLLTEADLIALMEKHGIGTDATHAEHIETIKSRTYVRLTNDDKFVPAELGLGLVDGYDSMGFEMSKPNLRAELEADLKRISEGLKDPKAVLEEQIQRYKEIFIQSVNQANKIDQALSQYFGQPQEYLTNADVQEDFMQSVCKCPKCGTSDIVIRPKKNGPGYYLGCLAFPVCRAAIWFPECVESMSIDNTICDDCRPMVLHKLRFKFKRGAMMPYYPDEYVGCIGGCDPYFLECLNVQPLQSSTPSAGTIDRSIINGTAPVLENFSEPISRDGGYYSNARNQMPPYGGGGGGFRGNEYQPAPPYRNTTFHVSPDRTPLSRALNDVSQTRGGDLDQQEVLCNCGVAASLMTVRKNGPNFGRQFYACSQPQEQRCNFFLWHGDFVQGTNNAVYPYPQARPYTDNMHPGTSNSAMCIMCQCGEEAKLLTVQKDGPNKGREFYTCPKGRGQGCSFFQWADGPRPVGGGTPVNTYQPSIPGPSNTHFQQRLPTGRMDGSITRKRKCGICGQEGHTRRKCPQNQ